MVVYHKIKYLPLRKSNTSVAGAFHYIVNDNIVFSWTNNEKEK